MSYATVTTRGAGAEGGGGRAASRGVWCTDASVGTVARIVRSGIDWVCVDMQHGRYGRAELVEIARTVNLAGASVPLGVRVPSSESTGIGFALDAGARIVIVPQVESADEARRVVEATFYPPIGRRSWGPLTPSWGATATTPEEANPTIVCAAMIESANAIAQVEEIAAVPGLSMLFIGPFDLALSLGTTVPALLDADAQESVFAHVRDVAHAHGLRVGAFGGDPATSAALAGLGIDDVAWVTDGWLLGEGLRSAFLVETSD
ncbi:HpcH/HpaI aldolase/citrate lyase family protein [Streptomyces sp. S1D4-11]|nr:aldolase/citrate lyase family protein [Streptomyces sp. S1D4-11]QIZ00747.1 aldolase [Streptomyces sp. S1D4-11]